MSDFEVGTVFGYVFGVLTMIIIISAAFTGTKNITDEKNFIIGNASYVCKKTNELKND